MYIRKVIIIGLNFCQSSLVAMSTVFVFLKSASESFVCRWRVRLLLLLLWLQRLLSAWQGSTEIARENISWLPPLLSSSLLLLLLCAVSTTSGRTIGVEPRWRHGRRPSGESWARSSCKLFWSSLDLCVHAFLRLGRLGYTTEERKVSRDKLKKQFKKELCFSHTK